MPRCGDGHTLKGYAPSTHEVSPMTVLQPTRAAALAAALVAACLALSVPASAAAADLSPYAEPLEALGGLTLGQYVAQHQAASPRLPSW